MSSKEFAGAIVLGVIMVNIIVGLFAWRAMRQRDRNAEAIRLRVLGGDNLRNLAAAAGSGKR